MRFDNWPIWATTLKRLKIADNVDFEPFSIASILRVVHPCCARHCTRMRGSEDVCAQHEHNNGGGYHGQYHTFNAKNIVW